MRVRKLGPFFVLLVHLDVLKRHSPLPFSDLVKLFALQTRVMLVRIGRIGKQQLIFSRLSSIYHHLLYLWRMFRAWQQTGRKASPNRTRLICNVLLQRWCPLDIMLSRLRFLPVIMVTHKVIYCNPLIWLYSSPLLSCLT